MKFVILFSTALIVCIQASKYDSFVHPLSDEFIDLVNEKATTWKAGRNFPRETSMKHIKRLMGTFLEPKNSNVPTKVHNIPDDFDPDYFDARENWPECPTVGEIRDQGDCGSCWATASVEVMSDKMCTLTNGSSNFHYSIEDLLSCCPDCGDGCDGGYVDAAFDYWIDTGIVSGGPYDSSQGCSPYQMQPCEHHINGSRPDCESLDEDRTPSCQKTCEPSYGIEYNKDLHFGEKDYTLKSVEDAIYEIVNTGPIVTAFRVYDDFLSYKSGVYVHKSGQYLGGHAVRVLGFGTEDGVDYWLCANSWNTDWGDKGFFKIRRGTNECRIESHFRSGKPKFS